MMVESIKQFVAYAAERSDRATPLRPNQLIPRSVDHERLNRKGSASRHYRARRTLRTKPFIPEPRGDRIKVSRGVGILVRQLLTRIHISPNSRRDAQLRHDL